MLPSQTTDVRNRRLRIMLYIMADTGWREGICWSVWSPRSSFLERTSPRLKAFNHLFSDLGASRAFLTACVCCIWTRACLPPS